MIITSSHRLMSVAADYLPKNPLIVEAGAFLGHDSLKMVAQWPQATIHAFEPIPEVFNGLVDCTKQFGNIVCHQQALSTIDGDVKLHLAYKKDQLTQASSLHEPDQRLQFSKITFPKTLSVPAVTLKTFMNMHTIDTIDLLWLDMQGHEYSVLEQAVDLLPHIKMLHVEVYFIQAYKNHILYAEFVAWIEKRDFVVIAQDFKDTPTWFFGNILCVQKNYQKSI